MTPAPAPVMVVVPLVSLSVSSWPASVIVLGLAAGKTLALKLIVSAPRCVLAATIASRSVVTPSPEFVTSDKLLTVNVDKSCRRSSGSSRNVPNKDAAVRRTER